MERSEIISLAFRAASPSMVLAEGDLFQRNDCLSR